MRARRAVPTQRRRARAGRQERRAARAVGRRGRRRRPDGRGPERRPLRLPPRLPGQPARGGLRLRGVGACRGCGRRADDVQPRDDRGRPGRPARPSVLVLLPLQRLHQQARGRLGDGPARLRRRRRGGGPGPDPDRRRLHPARGPRGRPVGRPEARDRRRHPPGRAPGRRLARQLLRGRALPRHVRRAGVRLRRRPQPRRRPEPHHRRRPERPGGREGRVPVARVRGPLGPARGGVLQRADGAEHQDELDPPDQLPGAERPRPQLRRARRRPVRHLGHRLLLRHRLEWLRGRPQARGQPRAPAPRAGAAGAARGLAVAPHHLDAGHSPAHRPAPGRRAADPGRRADVPVAVAVVHRDRVPDRARPPSWWPRCRA